MPARRITAPDAEPTPVEQRGEKLDLKFTRGREWTSWSHLALEAAEFANQYSDKGWEFHKRLFKAYFEELQDLGSVDILIALAHEVGIDSKSLAEALKDRRFQHEVDEGIAWSRRIGVTAIPTFIFNERLGMVGAQELPALREMMRRAGNPSRDGSAL
jgi:predicted DsbA family dithiol-disulfide isomerase